MSKDYVCTLTDKSLEKAKKELNEDPKNRLGAVETLREWIEQQKHLNCITSTEFLLPYLRTAKFSQLRAREIIEGYLTLATELPHWYHNLDPKDPSILEALKLGLMVPLPGVDDEGRKVLLFNQGGVPHKKLKDKAFKDAVFKSFIVMLKYMLMDENNQVNGFVYLNDFTGYTMAHFTTWSMSDIKDMMRWQGNYPGRFKHFYYYNTGSIFETIMEAVRPFMGKKFKDRIVVIGSNLEKVYKVIPMRMLPVELLPDDYTGPNPGSMKDLIENNINELHKPEIRDRLVYESSPEWKIDKSAKDTLHPSSSFRKLTLD